MKPSFLLPILTATIFAPGLAFTQEAPPFPRPDGPPPFSQDGRPPFGPGGPGGGGPMQQERKLVEKFDKNGNGRLDAAERKAARESLAKDQAEGRGQRRRGPGPMGRREDQTPPQPGAKLSPADVKSYPAASLYDLQALRTVFLEFEGADWEKELAEFKNTDVEVPAKLTVDGKTYSGVGVHFRGMSSFMMVGEGRKRSLNLSLDFINEKQRLGGYRTLNLLNSHEDPTFLRTVLFQQIAREYIPAPQANFVRVVINGESWGVYVNAEQFNKDFTKEWFSSSKGARWKAPGSPMGNSSFEYVGDDVAEYKKRFELKSKEDPKVWADLIQLCKVLNQTPADQLEATLAPLLDIDGALKFLALDNALINDDGYWIRSSDFSLYEDESGRFHIIPQDANETFSLPGGPGFGGRGPGGQRPPADAPASAAIKGVELDPLYGADNARKPLLSKLLAVPALRTRYLGYVRDIAEGWLDWNKLAPLVQQYQALIADDVKADTRKLDSYEEFLKASSDDVPSEGGFGHRSISLKSFVEQRRAFLLNHPEVKKAATVAAAH
jgi:hypothetical protein